MTQRPVVMILVLAGLHSAVSSAWTPDSKPGTAEYAETDAAIQAIRNGNCDDGLSYLRALEATDTFTRYKRDRRVWILEHIVFCLRTKDSSDELAGYLKTLVVAEGEERPDLLRQLIVTSILNEEPGIAVDAVKRLARFGLPELQVLANEAYFFVYVPLLNAGNLEELRYDYLRTLFLIGYTPGNPFESADKLMFDYAAMSVDRGDVQDLKKIILSVTEPGVILRIRVDRRFDEIRKDGDLEAFLDLENANNRYIAKLEGLLAEYPEFAFGHVRYYRALVGAWRFKDALSAIEPIAWRVRTPFLNRSFVDLDSSKNWVLEAYADAMWREEYPEQSEDMFVEAVQVPEYGAKNVSQQINLASRILYGGNLELALALAQDLLDTDANTSPYGAMWVHTILVCGNVLGKASKDVSQSMAYLTAHSRDNPGALIQALLCTNEMDVAAQFMRRRLESLDQRTSALIYLQYTKSDWEGERRNHIHEPGDELSPGHILWHRFDELRERPDVVRTANRVGRIEVAPLNSIIWHSY